MKTNYLYLIDLDKKEAYFICAVVGGLSEHALRVFKDHLHPYLTDKIVPEGSKFGGSLALVRGFTVVPANQNVCVACGTETISGRCVCSDREDELP